MDAALALHKAMYEALSNSSALTELLGEGKVFDEIPDQAFPPWLRFSASRVEPWNTATETGAEHHVEMEIWSPQAGRKQAGEIAEEAFSALQGINEIESPHSLANLELVSVELDRDRDSGLFRARMRIRAVTEENAN